MHQTTSRQGITLERPTESHEYDAPDTSAADKYLSTYYATRRPEIREYYQGDKDVSRLSQVTNTMMVQSDMKGAAKEMLLGHSIGMDDKYYRPAPQQLLEEYLKAVDLLTINDENRLRKKVEILNAKRDEMEILKGVVQQKEDRLSVIEMQMQTLISALGSIDQSEKNKVAKQLVHSSMYSPVQSK